VSINMAGVERKRMKVPIQRWTQPCPTLADAGAIIARNLQVVEAHFLHNETPDHVERAKIALFMLQPISWEAPPAANTDELQGRDPP